MKKEYPVALLENSQIGWYANTLETQVLEATREKLRIQKHLEAVEIEVKSSCARSAFEFPELAKIIRDKFNLLFALKKKPLIRSDMDPMSLYNRDGKVDDFFSKIFLEKKAKAEAELAEQYRSAEARKLYERCRVVFRKIAALTHPDRVSDTGLHPSFELARGLLTDHDLTGLEELHRNVRTYLLMKRTNFTFELFMKRKLKSETEDLKAIQQRERQRKAQLDFQCHESRKVNNQATRRKAYYAFVKDVEKDLDKRLEAEYAKQPKLRPQEVHTSPVAQPTEDHLDPDTAWMQQAQYVRTANAGNITDEDRGPASRLVP